MKQGSTETKPSNALFWVVVVVIAALLFPYLRPNNSSDRAVSGGMRSTSMPSDDTEALATIDRDIPDDAALDGSLPQKVNPLSAVSNDVDNLLKER